MRDFLAFRKMISTYVIQVVFWIGMVGIVGFFVVAISGDQALAGFLVLIFGTLYLRILCEIFIVFFRMNDTLTSIKVDTAAIPRGLSGRGGTPAATGTPTEEHTSVAGVEPVVVVPPEGWYPDSERVGHTRWWDGTAWGIRDDEHPSMASGSVRADDEGVAPSGSGPDIDDTSAAVEPSATPASAAASPSEGEPAPGTPSVRFCENCGAERSPSARFCTSCGQA